MIAVSLNVGGGIRLIKPAKLYKTLQTQRGRTHGAGCVRQWFRTAEPLGESRYVNWNTHTYYYMLDLSICQYKGVRSILSHLFYFLMENPVSQHFRPRSDYTLCQPTTMFFIDLYGQGPKVFPQNLFSHRLQCIFMLNGNYLWHYSSADCYTVKILKFGTPQTIAIIVLKIEKFDVTLH